MVVFCFFDSVQQTEKGWEILKHQKHQDCNNISLQKPSHHLDLPEINFFLQSHGCLTF